MYVEAFAKSLSLVQRSPTVRACVCVCVFYFVWSRNLEHEAI